MMETFASIPQGLVETLGLLKISVSLVALHMIRFVTAMELLPATAEQVVNGSSRTGIAMLLAFFVAAGQPVDSLQGLSGGYIGLLAVKEMVIGLALGFSMSIAFWVVEFVGAIIDNAAGYNSVQLNDPLNGQQSTPVSNMMSKLAVAVFFSLGGMIFFAQAMFDSFKVWPLLALMPSGAAVTEMFFLNQLDSLFISTIKLAAPFMLILFLIDLGLAILARSAEKLEPNNLAQPIKGILTILMLSLFVSVAFDQLRQYLVPVNVIGQMVSKPTPPLVKP